MDKLKFYFSPKCLLIITGASQGFGKELAKQFVSQYNRQFHEDSVLDNKITVILIARNLNRLLSLSDELNSSNHSRVNVITLAADLSLEDSIQSFENCLKNLNSSKFEHSILIHNAGSVGNPSQLCCDVKVSDSIERSRYYRLNLYSIMELTACFLSSKSIENSHKHIINISSLAAMKPFKGLLDYCVGKAAREAYFRHLAEEFQDSKTRILNYAPGPLETEMFRLLQKEAKFIREDFLKMQPLKLEVSVAKLLKILESDQYSNGCHIDYYDV